MRRTTAYLSLIFLFAAVSTAQKPNVTNAALQQVSAAGGLKQAFDSIVQKQETPAWIGYTIPTTPKERTMCCFDSWDDRQNSSNCCMGCRLESGKGSSFSGTVSNCTPPEPARYAFILFRVEQKQVEKIRTFSPDCALDFAGLPLYWLDNADPAQSIQLLTSFVMAETAEETQGKKSRDHHAIEAIALHDSPAADQTLEQFIQRDKPESLRSQVAFWLGVERGKKGLELLRKYVINDPDDRFRAKGTFAISQSKEPDAIKDLISMARNDPSSHVRSQGIFWLAQIGGRKEAEEITDAIANDPETEVKKRAVFALSQMKNPDGVSLLIDVAKNNKNPVVRREAIRWLGMTNDPRALDYLEQILLK